MDANAIALLDVFEKKMRLEIPMFQRKYVWSKEHQWEPLWEDISRKLREFIDGREDPPIHFLGAMVLDQKQTQTGRVERRSVIDGQQRLTTLQIFLAAFRDFCREEGLGDFGDECEKYTLNSGKMAEPDVEKFKVWPTLADRSQFIDVIESGSRAELTRRHPITRRPYARKDNPRPLMVEAYIYFHGQIVAFFKGEPGYAAAGGDRPLEECIEECFQALRTALKIVAIDLDKSDDAQVIFETLNARGEPLLPADLLRNYIFLRAARQGEEQEQLYKTFWAPFDEAFWREEIVQGRLRRPRSDVFLQHYLASKQAQEIPIKHLFVEYKYWIDRSKPFSGVREELANVSKQGKDFRRLISRGTNDVLGPLAIFLEIFDVSTAFPPLLAMLDAEAGDQEMSEVARLLESYMLRRVIYGAETKAYNRIFLGLTRTIRREGATAAVVSGYLKGLNGFTEVWPSDEQFSAAWMTASAYGRLNNARIVFILRKLSDTYLTSRSEAVTVNGPLTVEHLMPNAWSKHWPLPDGTVGIENFWGVLPEDPRVGPSRQRNAAIQTFGNLTLITGSLNSSISNGSWKNKVSAIRANSLLPLNLQLRDQDVWDETSIAARGSELLGRALKIWRKE